jgi:hypothetical protein
MLSRERLLMVAIVTVVATLSSGCQSLFPPAEVPVELRFVVDNSNEFGPTEGEVGRIAPGVEIDVADLVGCWGSSVVMDLDLYEGADAETVAFVDAVRGATGTPRVIPVVESAVYVFDMVGGTMSWQTVADAASLISIAQVKQGRFELLDGNTLRFQPETLSFTDPLDGSLLTTPRSSFDPYEWLITIDGDILRLQAVNLPVDVDNDIVRDAFAFHRFACP